MENLVHVTPEAVTGRLMQGVGLSFSDGSYTEKCDGTCLARVDMQF